MEVPLSNYRIRPYEKGRKRVSDLGICPIFLTLERYGSGRRLNAMRQSLNTILIYDHLGTG
jgi:hypothetical protein